MNNNFNLKQFLAEGKLLKEETNPSYKDFYEAFMDAEIEDHKDVPADSTDISLEDLENEKNVKVNTLEDLAQQIKNIDDMMTSDQGESEGSYHEELLNKIEMLGKSTNFPEIDKLISLVDDLYM
jgi:hypothetical protein